MTKTVTKLFLNISILFIVEKPIKYIAFSILKTFVKFTVPVGKQTKYVMHYINIMCNVLGQ